MSHGVHDDNAVVAGAYPEVVVIGHDTVYLVVCTVYGHQGELSGGAVVAVKSCGGAYPQGAVGSLAERVDQRLLATDACRYHDAIEAVVGQTHKADTAHVGHHPERALAIPYHLVDDLVAESAYAVVGVIQTGHGA